MTRVIPYSRKFQVAITFEIDLTLYEMTKIEYTVFDWLSAIGGLGSILFTISQAFGAFEDAQMYVMSAMIRDGENGDSMSDSKHSLKKSSTYSPTEVQNKCCTTLKTKVATSSVTPQCCKRKCGSKQDRILNEVFTEMQSCMYAHNLFMLLRVFEGILREKLELTE